MPRIENRWATPENDDITPLEPWQRCGDVTEGFGAMFTCERPRGHDGNHGAGAFIQYTTSWGQEDS